MKIKVTAKSILILILIFSIVFCITGAAGYSIWKNSLSINIDPEVTYVLNETDLTLPVQYTEMTETFILSFIFTFYGLGVGFMINTFILFCFILLRLIIDNKGFFDYRYKKYHKEEIKEKEDKKNQKNTKNNKKVKGGN